MAVSIGELLVREQRVTPAQIEHALELASIDESVGQAVVRLGFVADDELTALLSREHGVPWIDLSRFEIDSAILELIPTETAHKYRIVPLARGGATLTVALTEPANVLALDDIQFMTGCRVEPVLASEPALCDALDRWYPDPTPPAPALNRAPHIQWNSSPTGDPLELVSKGPGNGLGGSEESDQLAGPARIDIDLLERESTDAPVVRIVNVMLMSAIQRGASDIHLEPYERELRIRFRIDGVLIGVMAPALRFRDAITSRIKIMARLDIAEKRLPQDGRMTIRCAAGGVTRVVDFRVSSLPTLFGEKLVLRLLDKQALRLELAGLGLEPEPLRAFQAAVARPWGMVLVTGPTGSGKTSTLYSAISAINTPDTNIMTAEDPIEFNLAGVNQVQVRDAIGLTFAAVLRAFLRQDPDVILVGEIRDSATAEIAVKAALTGHLVLSTLHTNDAPSTIARLVNLGIPPFLVTSSVNLICAQRLVRRICTECAEEDRRDPQFLLDLGFTAEQASAVVPRRGMGCASCGQRGYAGRVGLYEVMEMTDALRERVLGDRSAAELTRAALADGLISLREAGLRKVAAGATTVDEVMRETIRWAA